MQEHHYLAQREVNLHGILAGLLAGLVMSIFKMVTDFLRGAGLWLAPQMIATILLGPDAVVDGNQLALMPVAVGFLLHFATSAVMGSYFFLFLNFPLIARYPVWWGVAYGFVAWLVAQYWLLPPLSETMIRNTPPFQLMVAHLIFGWVLGLYAGWRQKSRFTRLAEKQNQEV